MVFLFWLSVALLVLSLFKWFHNYVLFLTMVYYIEKSGYTQPSKKETEECAHFVVKRLIKDLVQNEP